MDIAAVRSTAGVSDEVANVQFPPAEMFVSVLQGLVKKHSKGASANVHAKAGGACQSTRPTTAGGILEESMNKDSGPSGQDEVEAAVPSRDGEVDRTMTEAQPNAAGLILVPPAEITTPATGKRTVNLDVAENAINTRLTMSGGAGTSKLPKGQGIQSGLPFRAAESNAAVDAAFDFPGGVTRVEASSEGNPTGSEVGAKLMGRFPEGALPAEWIRGIPSGREGAVSQSGTRNGSLLGPDLPGTVLGAGEGMNRLELNRGVLSHTPVAQASTPARLNAKAGLPVGSGASSPTEAIGEAGTARQGIPDLLVGPELPGGMRGETIPMPDSSKTQSGVVMGEKASVTQGETVLSSPVSSSQQVTSSQPVLPQQPGLLRQTKSTQGKESGVEGPAAQSTASAETKTGEGASLRPGEVPTHQQNGNSEQRTMQHGVRETLAVRGAGIGGKKEESQTSSSNAEAARQRSQAEASVKQTVGSASRVEESLVSGSAKRADGRPTKPLSYASLRVSQESFTTGSEAEPGEIAGLRNHGPSGRGPEGIPNQNGIQTRKFEAALDAEGHSNRGIEPGMPKSANPGVDPHTQAESQRPDSGSPKASGKQEVSGIDARAAKQEPGLKAVEGQEKGAAGLQRSDTDFVRHAEADLSYERYAKAATNSEKWPVSGDKVMPPQAEQSDPQTGAVREVFPSENHPSPQQQEAVRVSDTPGVSEAGDGKAGKESSLSRDGGEQSRQSGAERKAADSLSSREVSDGGREPSQREFRVENEPSLESAGKSDSGPASLSQVEGRVVGEKAPVSSKSTADAIDFEKAVNELVKEARLIKGEDKRHVFHLTLNDGDERQIKVVLDLDRNRVNTRFIVEDPVVRDILQTRMEDFQAGLRRAGVSTGRMDVFLDMAAGGREQQNPNQGFPQPVFRPLMGRAPGTGTNRAYHKEEQYMLNILV